VRAPEGDHVVLTLHQLYEARGHTDVLPVVGAEVLRPIHELIYLGTAAYLVEHDARLPLVERISLPFRTPPPDATWSRLMTMINDSVELSALCDATPVREAFERLFEGGVVPFGISRFRAQFPGQRRSVYGWHQDEATWYAVAAKELAYRGPATLWLSLNGADASNSIEIMPESHRGHLENHHFAEGQGYFRAVLPAAHRGRPMFVVEAEPGEGVFFHPLAFHRSVPVTGTRPRYSVDVRYYAANAPKLRYPVRVRLRAKRLVAR
jgi:hypothetical protein